MTGCGDYDEKKLICRFVKLLSTFFMRFLMLVGGREVFTTDSHRFITDSHRLLR